MTVFSISLLHAKTLKFFPLNIQVGHLFRKTLFVNLHRKETSLCHVALVAKFLDDNKPKKLLKSLFELFRRSYSVLFNLANLGEIFFETISNVI